LIPSNGSKEWDNENDSRRILRGTTRPPPQQHPKAWIYAKSRREERDFIIFVKVVGWQSQRNSPSPKVEQSVPGEALPRRFPFSADTQPKMTTLIAANQQKEPENQRGRRGFRNDARNKGRDDAGALRRARKGCFFLSPPFALGRTALHGLFSKNRTTSSAAQSGDVTDDDSSSLASSTATTDREEDEDSPEFPRDDASILKVRTQERSLARTYARSSRSQRKCRVSFSNVYVHSHYIILGDNPSVSSGPPLSIDWGSPETSCIPVDFHATCKGGRGPPPRSGDALRLSPDRRVKILKSQGFTAKELKTAGKLVEAAQESRQRSILEQICAAKGVQLPENFSIPLVSSSRQGGKKKMPRLRSFLSAR